MKRIKYEYCLFRANRRRKGIFDKEDFMNKIEFDFLKLETPRQAYLINMGAKYVIESWTAKGKTKNLHTGLFPLGRNIFIGDVPRTERIKDFILVIIDDNRTDIHFFLVRNKNPKRKQEFGVKLYDQICDDEILY